jgi:hypothetical protein
VLEECAAQGSETELDSRRRGHDAVRRFER